jgi:transposase
MTDHSIGIDISKDHLDAHRLIDGQSHRFANDKAGHQALIAWIGSGVVRVVHEPTGPYHRKLEQALAAARLPLVKVNPRQARRFFEGAGQLATNRSAGCGDAGQDGIVAGHCATPASQ